MSSHAFRQAVRDWLLCYSSSAPQLERCVMGGQQRWPPQEDTASLTWFSQSLFDAFLRGSEASDGCATWKLSGYWSTGQHTPPKKVNKDVLKRKLSV